MQIKSTEPHFVVILNDKFYANDFNGSYPIGDNNQPWTSDLNKAKLYHDRRKAQAMINYNTGNQDKAMAGVPHYYIPGCKDAWIRGCAVSRELDVLL